MVQLQILFSFLLITYGVCKPLIILTHSKFSSQETSDDATDHLPPSFLVDLDVAAAAVLGAVLEGDQLLVQCADAGVVAFDAVDGAHGARGIDGGGRDERNGREDQQECECDLHGCGL
jgi:hypothetical protein